MAKAKQKKLTAFEKAAETGRDVLESVIATGDKEVLDLYIDIMVVVASKAALLAEARNGESFNSEDEDEDEDEDELEDELEDEDEDDLDEDEDEDDLDEDEDEDELEDDEDEDELEDDEDEDDLDDDEDDEDDEDEDEDEDDLDDEDEDDEDEDDLDDDDEDDEEEDDEEEEDDDEEEEDEEEDFSDLSLSDLKAYFDELEIDYKGMMGTVKLSDKEAAQAHLAELAQFILDAEIKAESLKLSTVETRLKKLGETPEYGRVRKEEKKMEIAAFALACAQAKEKFATVKAKAKKAKSGGKKRRSAGSKKRRSK